MKGVARLGLLAKAVARLGQAVAVPLFILFGLCALLTSQFITPSLSAPFTPSLSAALAMSPSAPLAAVGARPTPNRRDRADAADGVVDLYGNEVTAAIAAYRLDASGGLYELHSPQTELPRLAAPKS
jgi:hypothetical protein